MILVQATINLFAVMGMAPLTGVPLPFVSYGNSSLLVTLFAVGLILNVARGGTAAAGKLRVVEGGRTAAARKRSQASRQTVEKAPRVVVAAGGTAGHVVPAMAVAAELRASGAEVSFLGTRERIEAELVPAAGYEIDFLKVRGIDRRNPLRAARAGAEAVGAVGAARRALRRRGADVVLGGGGYVAGPAGLAALLSADAAGAQRGRQPSRPRQPPARRSRPARLPRLPDRRTGGRALPAHRAPRSRGDARGRPGDGARAFRHRRRGALPAGDGRQPGRALDQPGGG